MQLSWDWIQSMRMGCYRASSAASVPSLACFCAVLSLLHHWSWGLCQSLPDAFHHAGYMINKFLSANLSSFLLANQNGLSLLGLCTLLFVPNPCMWLRNIISFSLPTIQVFNGLTFSWTGLKFKFKMTTICGNEVTSSCLLFLCGSHTDQRKEHKVFLQNYSESPFS